MFASSRVMPALILITVGPMMVIAGLWRLEWNFGPVMIMAGLICVAHFGWRVTNPDWMDDPFWSRHPRLRDFLRFYFIPRFFARRLISTRGEKVTAVLGILWGAGGVAIGIAQLTGAYPA
jgi:hypothetical protein